MDNIRFRESNFELLRIISMMMIIGLHYFNSSMGGAIDNVNSGTINYYLTYLLESIFIIGVNVFVLISGYFMINKERVNIRKCIDLLVLLAFYGVSFYTIRVFIGVDEFSIKELIKVTLPILTGKRWFVRTYIILFVLSPFINKSLKSLSRENFKVLLMLLILLFSIWPSFIPYPPVNDGGYGIINFIVLYSIGGYIRLYYESNKNINNYIFILLTSQLITFIFSLKYNQISWRYDFISNIIGSVMIFLIFKNIKLKSKRINFFSKYAFGVYIIHCDSQVCEFIYRKILKCELFYNSNFYIVHIFISILMIYLVCSVIDFFREHTFTLITNKIIDKIKIFNTKIVA